jgi:NAD(P)-dependent dehydrogenase (short-subunit alcohol dehydrogenase family)
MPVIGLTRAAACEVASRGVRVNAVCPGPVDTRMIHSVEAQLNSADPASAINPAIPMGRCVMPEEITYTVFFLCSDFESAITGAQYVVDGARTATGGAVTQALQS